MCVGCRQRFDQRHLLRVQRRTDGELRVVEGQPFGRSAYLCQSLDCWRMATRKNALARAFRARVRWNLLESSLDAARAGRMSPRDSQSVAAKREK
jgi:predicted RNA-binding protein YlxR (DUF448 family)